MHRDSPSTFPPPIDHTNPNFPEHEHLKCPRCDSSNTKFCYYNNYNLSQPRHFCKNCRRYWTKGGTLRNIPVGGGTRKITKRSSNSAKRDSPASNPSPFTESPVSAPMCTDSPVSATLRPSLTADSPVISPPQRLLTTESPLTAPPQPSPVTAALPPSLTTDSPVISPPQRLLTTESPLIAPPQPSPVTVRLQPSLTTKSPVTRPPPPQTTLTTESPVTAPPQTWQTTTPPFPPPPQPESELETEKEPETGPSVVCRLGNDHQTESSGGGGYYSMKGFGDLLMVGSNFNLLRKSDEDVLIRNPNAGDFGANFLRLNDVKNQTSGSERGESSCWNGGDNGWPDLSIITPGSTFH